MYKKHLFHHFLDVLPTLQKPTICRPPHVLLVIREQRREWYIHMRPILITMPDGTWLCGLCLMHGTDKVDKLLIKLSYCQKRSIGSIIIIPSVLLFLKQRLRKAFPVCSCCSTAVYTLFCRGSKTILGLCSNYQYIVQSHGLPGLPLVLALPQNKAPLRQCDPCSFQHIFGIDMHIHCWHRSEQILLFPTWLACPSCIA